jgi:hypothetical protein
VGPTVRHFGWGWGFPCEQQGLLPVLEAGHQQVIPRDLPGTRRQKVRLTKTKSFQKFAQFPQQLPLPFGTVAVPRNDATNLSQLTVDTQVTLQPLLLQTHLNNIPAIPMRKVGKKGYFSSNKARRSKCRKSSQDTLSSSMKVGSEIGGGIEGDRTSQSSSRC